LAQETVAKNSSSANSLDDYEQQVRSVAEKNAAEAKAKKEAARLVTQGNPAEGELFRVFKYKKGGATTFSDSAPYRTKYEVVIYNSCYACALTSNVDWFSTRLYLSEFSHIIAQAATEYSVDEALVRAIIHAESAFNPLAQSRKGAMGLMQLMPSTARDMGVTDSASPEQNIRGGVKYLSFLLKTFSGNASLAAAAYNAGPGAVTRHGGIPPFEETQTYVKRVKILFDRYKTQKALASR
jgi:soluble lytic murein transglycosylase-like protein